MAKPTAWESKIKPNLPTMKKMREDGATEAEIIRWLGIGKKAFYAAKKERPELREAMESWGLNMIKPIIGAGVEAAIGYYKENETVRVFVGADGQPRQEKVVTKIWYPPNPILNKFYAMNFAKSLSSEPMEQELRQRKDEREGKVIKAKNWNVDWSEGEKDGD